jgi:hypothetical protein
MKYVFVYGGAIGDALVGMHLGRTLALNRPGARLLMLSTRRNPFVKDLARHIPSVAYHELPKDALLSWLALPFLALTPSCSVVYEPTIETLPPWWRLIIRLATFLPGSRDIRQFVRGHERNVRSPARALIFEGPTDNLFMDTVPRTLLAWGVPVTMRTIPTLPIVRGTARAPYILFHFFAGNYRRSFPLEKVQPLLREARTRFPDHEFILSATPTERERALAMVEGIKHARVESNLTATQVLELLSGAALAVGVASGVLHMAAQLPVPSIALANRSDPYWLPTYSTTARIISDTEHCRCAGNKTGDCTEHTQGGEVFRCLYYIRQERIIEEMAHALA